jgi:hypothetical protein
MVTDLKEVLILTEHDRAVLGDLVRFGALTRDQIARRWFGSRPRAATLRLTALATAGYVRRTPPVIAGTDVYTATRRGTFKADVGLGPVEIDFDHLRHDLAVADLADWLLEREPDTEWVTERELRAAALDAARLDGSGRLGRGAGHIPDGLLVTPKSRTAIELERTAKRPLAYDRIFRWYAAAVQFDGVRWFVVGRALLAYLTQLVERYGLASTVSVEPLPAAVRILPWAR